MIWRIFLALLFCLSPSFLSAGPIGGGSGSSSGLRSDVHLWTGQITAGTGTGLCMHIRGHARTLVTCTNDAADNLIYLPAWNGKITGFYCTANTVAGANTTWTFTVQNGGVDTLATATTATNGGTATFSGSVNFAPPTFLTMKVTHTGASETQTAGFLCEMAVTER